MSWYDGAAAALLPRACGDRPGAQPRRRALPGAVGQPADERGAPRLPRLRRTGRGRRAAPRRRGRGAAERQRAPRISSIDTFDGPLELAFPTMSVMLRLSDDVDVSRGDMIVAAEEPPAVARELEASICWMSDQPLRSGGRYTIKHTTRSARAIVDELMYQVDVNTLSHEPIRGSRPERDRPRPYPLQRSADRRSLRAQPRHRQLHPDRRGDQRHRRRGHDQNLELASRPSSSAAGRVGARHLRIHTCSRGLSKSLRTVRQIPAIVDGREPAAIGATEAAIVAGSPDEK